MVSAELRDRLILILVGILIIFTPAVLVLITIEFLVLTGDLALSQITLLEFVELYIIDLALFVVFGYGVYRITLSIVAQGLPQVLDRLNKQNGTEIGNEDSEKTNPVNDDDQ